jgi:hypothetical protein
LLFTNFLEVRQQRKQFFDASDHRTSSNQYRLQLLLLVAHELNCRNACPEAHDLT